jgi:hypothetical protein
MNEKESISQKIDSFIKGTINTINNVYESSNEKIEFINSLFQEIMNEQNNPNISFVEKKEKIKLYLQKSQEFNLELYKISDDVQSKTSYFKSEAAEEK